MTHPFTFTAPTDKMPGSWHGAYLPVYARLFAPLKDTEDSILELGVDGAGSLLMYADYFHRSNPFGIDIQGKPSALEGNNRVTFIQGNGYSETSYQMFSKLAPFALIVDDGPHTIESQKWFCGRYPFLLSNDGLAIVEDVQDIDNFAQLAASLPPDFFGYGIDLRMHDGRYDNLLFVIQRR